MRIAFVVNNFPPRVGGLETHVYGLARHLVAAGHEVRVLALTDEVDRRFEDDLDVIRFREFLRIGDVLGFPVPGTTRRVVRDLAQWRPDVISVHTRFFPMSWVGLRVARRLGVPLIHTEHGSGHVASESRVIRWGSRAVDFTFGRAVLRGATQVLGVSEKTVAFVEKLSGRKAKVFYNAIEPAGEVGEALPAPEGLKVVFVGRLVSGKGSDVFIDVVAELRERGVDASAVVLGDGPERSRLEASIADAQLQDRVVLRGRVAADEVQQELHGAILVNPSVLAEGFQITLLEALAAGGRVVSYDVPGGTVLAGQGHPVEVVREQNASALAEAVMRMNAEPVASRPSLSEWYWPERAVEYARICEELVPEAP